MNQFFKSSLKAKFCSWTMSNLDAVSTPSLSDAASTPSSPDDASTLSCPDVDDGDNSVFPYESLPNEMREAILKNIHDPQDKLNTLEALPATKWLMHWLRTTIQFELVEK